MASKKKPSTTDKIKELIAEKKIFSFEDPEGELHDHFMVKGSNRDYLVKPPDFCSCDDFIFRKIKTPGSVCYHIKAAQMVKNAPKIPADNWKDLFFLTEDREKDLEGL